MPTNRQIIEQMVDEKIAKGLVAPALREQQINTLAADEQMAAAWAADMLRANDYTNKTKQLAEERRQAAAEIEAQRRAVQAERQRLQDWERTSQTEIAEANRIRDEHTRLVAKAAAMEQTLRDYNMLDYVSVPPITEPARTTPVNPPNNSVHPNNPNQPSHFITRDDAAGALREMMQINGKVLKIAAKHQQLFGESLDDDLYSHYMTTGEDPEKYWETKYAVSTKVAELQAKQREAEIARIREEERTKLLSEMAMDPSRVVGAPIFGKSQVNPVMEAYAHSRATHHAENGANLDAATGTDNWVPPEKRSELAMARDRIARSSEMFVKNFDVNGNPISDEGRQLYRKHIDKY